MSNHKKEWREGDGGGDVNRLLSLMLFMLMISSSVCMNQREILEKVYFACGGANWTVATNWMNPNASLCDWYGITCSHEGYELGSSNDIKGEGRTFEATVTGVDLHNNNLQCVLPPQIFYLNKLESLHLDQNPNLDIHFHRVRPGAAKRLKFIRLSDAGLTSLHGIDVALAASKSALRTLILRANILTGPFPTSILSLTKLKQLDLSYNFISGPIPTQLTNLTDLSAILISHNDCTGQIPSQFGTWTRMSVMDLSFNALGGTLPPQLKYLRRSTLLSFRSNLRDYHPGSGLSGPVLDFARMPELFWLDLANNELSGQVPSNLLLSVHPSTYLTMVDISDNKLTGIIPSSLTRFRVFRLYLIRNSIRGIASELCTQTNWFFGEVGDFGCDAILCPPGTFGRFGRQISDEFPCIPCPHDDAGATTAPNYGATECIPATRSASFSERQTVTLINPHNTTSKSTTNTAHLHTADHRKRLVIDPADSTTLSSPSRQIGTYTKDPDFTLHAGSSARAMQMPMQQFFCFLVLAVTLLSLW